jgi:hypothetical protein
MAQIQPYPFGVYISNRTLLFIGIQPAVLGMRGLSLLKFYRFAPAFLGNYARSPGKWEIRESDL